uniref:Uncharacterized protein n=1 Tax=Helicotheca tamesis TaxID=374047 RepID=A0A7S2HJ57_9STRA|mmetsp:Transcript_18606/g.25613  ORF Transcript_18606/g.25613 Transcript_18606/m.25613 type:complete len:203 (+) Transcript_18606:46-654(+)
MSQAGQDDDEGDDLAQALDNYVQDLDKFKIDFDSMPPPEWDMILSAAQKNQPERIRGLIEVRKIPASHSNFIGQTSLHIAVLWGNIECIEVLIEKGANVNAANSLSGDTPLHLAVTSNKTSAETKVKILDMLLEAGADTSVRDYSSKAPADYLKLLPEEYRAPLEEKLKAKPRNFEQMFLNDLMSEQTACIPLQSRFCPRPG